MSTISITVPGLPGKGATPILVPGFPPSTSLVMEKVTLTILPPEPPPPPGVDPKVNCPSPPRAFANAILLKVEGLGESK
jgi:hypothetical protein